MVNPSTQADLGVGGQLGLQGEFKDSQSYREKANLKDKTKQKKQHIT